MARLQDVADFFIDTAIKRNEEPMTNLRIQKMLYFAQAHHYSVTELLCLRKT